MLPERPESPKMELGDPPGFRTGMDGFRVWHGRMPQQGRIRWLKDVHEEFSMHAGIPWIEEPESEYAPLVMTRFVLAESLLDITKTGGCEKCDARV